MFKKIKEFYKLNKYGYWLSCIVIIVGYILIHSIQNKTLISGTGFLMLLGITPIFTFLLGLFFSGIMKEEDK